MCPKAARSHPHVHPLQLACSARQSPPVPLTCVLLASVFLIVLSACAPPQRSAGRATGTSTATAKRIGSVFTLFPLPARQGRLGSLIVVPGGDIWLTWFDAGKIGHLRPDGTVAAVYSLTDLHAGPYSLAFGSDGAIWFTESYAPYIGRISPSGQITEFGGLSAGATALTRGPDGNLWFSSYLGDSVGRITPNGEVREIPLAPGSRPGGLTFGPDGSLWVTESSRDSIARVTLGGSGTVTEYHLPKPVSTVERSPEDIVVGPDYSQRCHHRVCAPTPGQLPTRDSGGAGRQPLVR
jgi:streptogramin lyase